MLGYQEYTNYQFGDGGTSPRVPPLPIYCPGGFPLWWSRDERFWDDQRNQHGWRRQPVSEG